MTEYAAHLEHEASIEGANLVTANEIDRLKTAITRDLFDELTDIAMDVAAMGGRDAVLDLSDRDDLDPETIVALRSHAQKMRAACDLVSRWLAERWVEEWGEGWMRTPDGLHVTVARTQGAWQLADREGFVAWLRDQPDDQVAKIVGSVRVGAMGAAARDTFCERRVGSVSISVSSVEGLPPGVRRHSDALPVGVPVRKDTGNE